MGLDMCIEVVHTHTYIRGHSWVMSMGLRGGREKNYYKKLEKEVKSLLFARHYLLMIPYMIPK